MKIKKVALVWVVLNLLVLSVKAEETPADKSAKTKPPKLELVSADGGTRLSFHLAAQFRWSYLWQDNGQGQDRSSDSKFMFRRLRPVAKGSLFSKDLTWLLHLNMVPGAMELLDLFMDYRLHPQLHLRLGEFKIPFTRYRLNSFKDLPLTDWSYPTQYFGCERQMGIMVHNGLGKPPTLEYQLGLFTGVNTRVSNGTAMPRVYGEKFQSSSDLVDPAPYDHLHSELVAHLAYNSKGMNVKRSADFEGGPPRFSVGFSAAWDADPRPLYDHRLRLAPEIRFKAHGFALDGVFYVGFHDAVTSDDSHIPGLLGALVQASYVFSEIYEIALRYTNVIILKDLRTDARLRADLLIVQAGDPELAASLADKYESVGLIKGHHEAGLGFNVYLFGTNLKWQTDLLLQAHQGTEDTLYDARVRSQLQLAF